MCVSVCRIRAHDQVTVCVCVWGRRREMGFMEFSRSRTLFSSVFPARNLPSFPFGSFWCSRFVPMHTRTLLHARVFCYSVRRHQRRRDMGMESRQKGSFRDDGSSSDGMRSHADSVVITLDPQRVKQRVEDLTDAAKRVVHSSAVRAVQFSKDILSDGRMFLEDLRSSISIQRDNRIVISLRRSSIDFALSALVWSALFIVAGTILVKAAKKYRWGWEESFDGHHVVKRDRSLGGREVLVGRKGGTDQRARREKQNAASARRNVNPLDAVEISRSERDMVKQRESKSLRKAHNQLPGWWPSTMTTLTSTPSAGDVASQEEASFLLKLIIEKRSIGKDFEVDDILQLRRLCKYSGAKVAFHSTYVRDSFYRAAIDMVLSSCGRSTKAAVDIGGEKAGEFLAGLADNISLEAERAAIMVNAAVAARTRSTFLQTWALQVQGKFLEADGEVTRLSYILAALPPDNNSPEMEMVAQGLGQHLSYDERSHLLEIYVKAGGSSTERIASEALGLHPTRKRS